MRRSITRLCCQASQLVTVGVTMPLEVARNGSTMSYATGVVQQRRTAAKQPAPHF